MPAHVSASFGGRSCCCPESGSCYCSECPAVVAVVVAAAAAAVVAASAAAVSIPVPFHLKSCPSDLYHSA